MTVTSEGDRFSARWGEERKHRKDNFYDRATESGMGTYTNYAAGQEGYHRTLLNTSPMQDVFSLNGGSSVAQSSLHGGRYGSPFFQYGGQGEIQESRPYGSGPSATTMNQICHNTSTEAGLDNESLAREYCSFKTVEKFIEVQEVQILERLVPVNHVVQREKVVMVPKVEIVERKVPVPKIVYEEKIIPVTQYQYKEVPFEKIVEKVEHKTQYVKREIPTPERVNVPMIQPLKAPVEQEIKRNIPVFVDMVTHHKYEIPKLKAVYKKVFVPIYVPRYIEVPVVAQLVTNKGPCQWQQSFSVQGACKPTACPATVNACNYEVPMPPCQTRVVKGR